MACAVWRGYKKDSMGTDGRLAELALQRFVGLASLLIFTSLKEAENFSWHPGWSRSLLLSGVELVVA